MTSRTNCTCGTSSPDDGTCPVHRVLPLWEESVMMCACECDHGSPCILYADHVPHDRHETQHGCIFYDVPTPAARPDWDTVWMGLALTLSRRSTCSRLSVGCVVVSHDNTRVLALGYNGGPRGLRNGCLRAEPGNCGCTHAETNTLIKLDYGLSSHRRMYVTSQPCYACAVAIVNSGVRDVVYGRPYRLPDGLALLMEAGVATRQFLPIGST